MDLYIYGYVVFNDIKMGCIKSGINFIDCFG